MPARSHACTFCSEEVKGRILMELETVYAIEDQYPVTQGHLLIVPFYHTLDCYTMTDEERRDAQHLLLVLKEHIMQHDPTVQGFSVVGINCGEAAGQSSEHAHIHLIPHRDGNNLFEKPFSYLR
jgi:diadenosine tetraphosphate (Ap4A) HIT family hydrolase